uniref:Uncharacterized protein n=1 Tax=Oryza glumipatula TaxID=40148 RepID=A0A0D9ZVX6_9ORYZ
MAPLRRRLSCCRWCHIRGSKSSRRMLRKEKNRGQRRQPWKRRAFKEEEICGFEINIRERKHACGTLDERLAEAAC